MKNELTEIRDLLAALVNEMAANGSAASEDIVRRFKVENPILLSAHNDALVRMALIKLVSDVSRRKPPSAATNAQGDFFYGYSGPSVLVPSRSGPSANRRKAFFNMTIAEVEIWLAERKQKSQSDKKDVNAVERILKAAKPFGTSKTTIRQALKAAGVAKQYA